ncbi:MAG: hypothetical protein ACI85I_002915, partial [Arenicella sp.]
MFGNSDLFETIAQVFDIAYCVKLILESWVSMLVFVRTRVPISSHQI